MKIRVRIFDDCETNICLHQQSNLSFPYSYLIFAEKLPSWKSAIIYSSGCKHPRQHHPILSRRFCQTNLHRTANENLRRNYCPSVTRNRNQSRYASFLNKLQLLFYRVAVGCGPPHIIPSSQNTSLTPLDTHCTYPNNI